MDKFPSAFDRFERSADFKESFESVRALQMSFGNFQGYFPTYKQRRCLENYGNLIKTEDEKPERISKPINIFRKPDEKPSYEAYKERTSYEAYEEQILKKEKTRQNIFKKRIEKPSYETYKKQVLKQEKRKEKTRKTINIFRKPEEKPSYEVYKEKTSYEASQKRLSRKAHIITFKTGRTTISYRDEKGRFAKKLSDS